MKKSPNDPMKSGGKQTSEPIHLLHQLGVMRNAIHTPQPGTPKFTPKLPSQSHSLVALKGMPQK